MKTILIIAAILVSGSLFAKGGVTANCQASRSLLAQALAMEIEDDIKLNIRYGYWNAGVKLKDEEIFQTNVQEVDDRIEISHEVKKDETHSFKTVYPLVKVEFSEENKSECVWKVHSLSFIKVMMLDPHRSMGSIDFMALRKIRIPLP